jgi:hypothetical protein
MARVKKSNRKGSARTIQGWESCCGCGGEINLSRNDWVIILTGEYLHHKQECFILRREKENASIPSFDDI